MIRTEIQPLTGLGTWICLPEGRREEEFDLVPKLRKGWRFIQKKREGLAQGEKVTAHLEPAWSRRAWKGPQSCCLSGALLNGALMCSTVFPLVC